MHTPPSHAAASPPPTPTDPAPEEGVEFWIALAVMVALFVSALLWVDVTAFGR